MKLTSIQHLKGLLCANKIARQSASSKAATFDVEPVVYFHLEKDAGRLKTILYVIT